MGRQKGYTHPDETKQKMRLSHKQYANSQEQVAALRKRRQDHNRCLCCGRELVPTKTGLRCSRCTEYNKKYRNEHRQHLNEVAKTRLRNAVFGYYGSVCACCGESNIEFLTIDHINGGGSKHRKERKGGNLYRWLIHAGFPQGFQTLCYNCNCARAKHNGICPHKI